MIIIEHLLAKLFVRPGEVVLDIGAHEGESAALYLAQGAGAVISFEPREAARSRFPEIVHADPRLTLQPFALSDRDGVAEIYVPSSGDGASSLDRSFLQRYRREDGTPETVEVRRLDGLELPHAGFWKIDAEGSELEILRGAEQTLSRQPPDAVQVEVFPRDWSRFSATLNFLMLRYRHVWGLGVTSEGRIISHPVSGESARSPAVHADLRRSGTPRYFASSRPFEAWAEQAAIR